MDSKIISQNIKSVNADFTNIKSDYFLQKLFNYLSKYKLLDIIKYNKKIQKRIHVNINDYQNYSEKFTPIEIEIIPIKNAIGKFINIKKEEEPFYHIYFDDNKEEIKKIFKKRR